LSVRRRRGEGDAVKVVADFGDGLVSVIGRALDALTARGSSAASRHRGR